MWHIGIYILHTHTQTHTYSLIQLKHSLRVYIRDRVDESGWSMLCGEVVGRWWEGRLVWTEP